MGVNMAGNCIIDDEVCKEASRQEIIRRYYQSLNRFVKDEATIAAGYNSAEAVHMGWREDNDNYAGQGHRRNMLSSKYNCVGIGHVYCNGFHYWVEEFAYRFLSIQRKRLQMTVSRLRLFP